MTNEDILYPIIVDMHNKIKNKQVLTDRTGVSYVELMAPRLELDPAQKLLDFGKRKTPKKYVEAELIWYDSQSLNVNYIGEYAKT
jgi:hypothetical protein